MANNLLQILKHPNLADPSNDSCRPSNVMGMWWACHDCIRLTREHDKSRACTLLHCAGHPPAGSLPKAVCHKGATAPGGSGHRSGQGHIGLGFQRSARWHRGQLTVITLHVRTTAAPSCQYTVHLHALWGMHCLGGKLWPEGLTRDSRFRCEHMIKHATPEAAAQSQPGGRGGPPVSPAPQHVASGGSSLNPYTPIKRLRHLPKRPLCEISARRPGHHGRRLTVQKRLNSLRKGGLPLLQGTALGAVGTK